MNKTSLQTSSRNILLNMRKYILETVKVSWISTKIEIIIDYKTYCVKKAWIMCNLEEKEEKKK